MKIQRKYMAHYLNAHFASDSTDKDDYIRLGKDLEEYSPELSANVEKKSNILGQTSVTIDSYQKQGEVSPYYAEEGDALFTKLQAIIDGDMVLDDLKGVVQYGSRRFGYYRCALGQKERHRRFECAGGTDQAHNAKDRQH